MNSIFERIIAGENYEDEFKDELEALINWYLINYNYLGLKEEAWEKVFQKAVREEPKIEHVSITLSNAVNNYISRCGKAKKMFLIHNYILKLKKEGLSAGDILKAIFSLAKEYHFKFDQEYFYLVKNDSKVFRDLLKTINIENFNYQQILSYVHGDYDDILLLKPYNKSLDWTVKTLNYIKSLLNYDLEPLSKENVIYNEHYKVIKYILRNYDTLNKIYLVFTEEIKVIKRDMFFKVVVNYSYRELNELMEEYANYKNISKERYRDFLNKIYTLTNKRIENRKSEVKEVKKAFNSLEDFFKTDKLAHEEIEWLSSLIYEELSGPRKLSLGKYFNRKLDDTESYKVFKFINNELKPIFLEKEKIYLQIKDNYLKLLIDYIPEADTEEEIKRIFNTLNEGKKQELKIWLLKKALGFKLTEDEALALKTIINYFKEQAKEKPKSVYDIFIYKDKPLDEKKEAIDYLLSFLSEEERTTLNKYLSNELDLASLRKFYPFLRKLKNDYKFWVNNGYFLKDYENVYNLFKEEIGEDKEKERIIYYMFMRMDKISQMRIINYLKGNLTDKDELKKVKYNIASLKKNFKNWENTGRVPEKKTPVMYNNFVAQERTIYEYFTYGNKPLKVKKAVIDTLMGRLDEKSRELLEDYLKGKITSEEEKRKTQKKLENIKKYYKKWVDTGILPKKGAFKLKKDKEIYDYFTYGDKPLEEKKEVIDHLLAKLSEPIRERIELYLKGEITDKELIKKTMNNLLYIEKNYERWVDTGILPKEGAFKLKKDKEIYDYFTYGDKPLEEKKEVIDYLLSRINPPVRERIELYLKGEITDTKEKRMVRYNISSINRNYERWVDTGFLPSKKKAKSKYISKKTKDSKVIPNKTRVDKLSLYDYFTYGDKTLEEKKEVIDYLFSLGSEEVQARISKYIKREEMKYFEVRKASGSLQALKMTYKKWVDTGYLPKKKKYTSIYMFLYEDETPQKRELADRILANIPPERRKLVQDFVNGDLTGEDKKKARNYIKGYLVKKYRALEQEKIVNNDRRYLQEVIGLSNFGKERLLQELDKLTEKKIKMLSAAIKIIEYKYRDMGIRKEQYELIVRDKLNQFLTFKDYDIYTLLRLFINDMEQNIWGRER